METPVWIASIIGLVVVVVAALVKDQVGKPKAQNVLDYAEAGIRRARLMMMAAAEAMLVVEQTIKKEGDKTPQELKQAAVKYASELLSSWGIMISPEILDAVAVMVESAYQRFKNTGKDVAKFSEATAWS